ncbi:RluA family pseudouridine synthase [Candidatus Magnetaquicoccus inordinatus]|uniref:RluA family pseudouridine synthase n=1 Tax=Candidatus Magnetaquicoccus inordinatus TaxID=2496818 RepID=UPI00102B7406|nr:RluA family pseudouridine synthase [Candidatus Magnetaquicoccus inordinatus]
MSAEEASELEEEEFSSAPLLVAGETIYLQIAEALAGERLDKALARSTTELSRTGIQRLLAMQAVLQQPAAAQYDQSLWQRVASDKERVKAGQWFALQVPAPTPMALQAEAIPLAILYEDQDLLVVNKPAGMTVHPGAGAEGWRGTLVNALLYHCRDSLSGIGGVERPGIVHRLDKETSGLLVVAKNDATHQHLSSQFAIHSTTRNYLAVLKGVPEASGTINAPIGRHPKERQKMAVVAHGRAAVTHFRRLHSWQGSLSLVRCQLETGRTHQIRVHLAAHGFPLLGDPLYGRSFVAPQRWPEEVRALVGNFSRQALHATSLAFTHPKTGKRLQFAADPPADFQQLVQALHSLA